MRLRAAPMAQHRHGDNGSEQVAESAADRAAERVLSMRSVPDAARCACGGGCPRCSPAAPSASTRASGTLLPAATRRFFEPRFGADFSSVHIHDDDVAHRAARAAGALAYTYGSDVVFAAGRYAPDTPPGRALLAHELAHVVQQAGGPPRVQFKKEPTTYGNFETLHFQSAGTGVEIALTFDPFPAKVDATKIALVQSVRAFNASGAAYAVNPTIANRVVPSGTQGAGYAIDASGKSNNPLYFDLPSLGAGKGLKDTPLHPAGSSVDPATRGQRTHYQIGHCYRLKPADAQKSRAPAGLFDHPEGAGMKGAGMSFETTALAIAGADAGTYYGSVSWGYELKDQGGTLTPQGTDIRKVSDGSPTPNFSAAASLWNRAKTRGTLVVNPTAGGNTADAYVEYETGGAGQPKRQPAGTKLRMIDQLKGSTDAMVKAEVLDASGQGTGVVIRIFVPDVKDMGDGSSNVALP
jgi:hypothetical protein